MCIRDSLHSAFSDSERAEQWRRIRAGGASVVVGTRSGVFAPVRNLGLIVVDEEHDGSYKQEENPRYNGRDVAIVRAQKAGACVVLGSATPSLESRYNASQGKDVYKRQVYVRVMRAPSAVLYGGDYHFEFGKSWTLREDPEDAAVIVTSGRAVHEALAAADECGRLGVRVGVVDMPCLLYTSRCV